MGFSFRYWTSYEDLPGYETATESERRGLRRSAWLGGLRFWGFWVATIGYGFAASFWDGVGPFLHLCGVVLVGGSLVFGMRRSMERLLSIGS